MNGLTGDLKDIIRELKSIIRDLKGTRRDLKGTIRDLKGMTHDMKGITCDLKGITCDLKDMTRSLKPTTWKARSVVCRECMTRDLKGATLFTRPLVKFVVKEIQEKKRKSGVDKASLVLIIS